MKKRPFLLLLLAASLFGFPLSLKAQTVVQQAKTSSPAKPVLFLADNTAPPSSQPTELTGAGDEKNKPSAENGDTDKPFVPHWTGQLNLNYSTQPTHEGQGQVAKDLTFTGTYNLTEGGHFFSLGLTGGQQLVEGANTNYGTLTVEGGLGLGVFLPSLSVALQEGAAALNSWNSTLTLNFKVLEPLTVGLTLGGGIESHQGPVSAIGVNSSDNIVEVDDADWNGGVVVEFQPWDFLSFSLTGQQEYDITFQYQNIVHTNVIAVNQSDRVPSLILGSDLTFWKNFELELSLQEGQEFYPAGTIYSRVLGKTVTFSKPTSQGFTGFTAGFVYNFE